MEEKRQIFLEMILSEFEMNLINLPELSIIIHYRRDCDDREFNLRTLLKFIDDHFTVNDIVLINDDKEFEKSLKSLLPEVINNLKLMFIENDDEFMKSYSFNRGAEEASGNVLAFWDVDVLVNPKHIEDAYLSIALGEYDHVYPFNGTFVDVKKLQFEEFLNGYKFDILDEQVKGQELGFCNGKTHIISNMSPGGCNLISRKSFDKIGGYDEKFIGWGFEDTDFRERSCKVNNVFYMGGDKFIYHLEHTTHNDQDRSKQPYYMNNMNTYMNNLK